MDWWLQLSDKSGFASNLVPKPWIERDQKAVDKGED